MKKIYKLTIPVVTLIVLLTTVLCCCIGKLAFANPAHTPSCHHSKSVVSHHSNGVNFIKAHPQSSCECSKVEILAAIDNKFKIIPNSISFQSDQSKKLLTLLGGGDYLFNNTFSVTGFSPQQLSAVNNFSPLYLKNSVLRI